MNTGAGGGLNVMEPVVMWADELELWAPPPERRDPRLLAALDLAERHLKARLAHQRTPPVPFVPDVDRVEVFERAIFADYWRDRTATFTTDSDWGVLLSFNGCEDYKSRYQPDGSRGMHELRCAMLVQEPYGVADPASLLTDLYGVLGAWHGAAGPFPGPFATTYPDDLRKRLVPRRLGWLNCWSDRSCELFEFPNRPGDELWLTRARRLPNDDGWLLQLTDSPLDMSLAEHREQVSQAAERFSLIHEVHPPISTKRRRDQS